MRAALPLIVRRLASRRVVRTAARCSLATWLAFGISGVASASDLWEGTVGGATVVVSLDAMQAGEDGRYFYRSHRLDLDLRTSTSHKLVWTETASGGDTTIARWVMDPPTTTENTSWTGSWIGNDGRRLPIRLQPLVLSGGNEAIAAVPDIDDYDRARLDGLHLEPSRTEIRDGYRLQWQRESTTGFEMFEFASGFSEPVRARINRALRASLWQAVKGRFECLSATHAREYTFKTTLRYLADDARSASAAASVTTAAVPTRTRLTTR